MTDILQALLTIISLAISFAAYFLIVGVFFSTRIAKTQRVISQTPRRAFGVGFINLLFFGAIALVLLMLTNGDNRVDNWVRIILFFPTLAVLALIGIVLTFGFAGISNVIGERIFADEKPVKRNMLGVVVLCVACALPFAGWFLLLPYLAFTGFGAVILGFFQRDTP